MGNPIRRREFGASAMTPIGGRHLRRSPEMATTNSSTVKGVKTLAGKFAERRCRTVEKALHGNSWSLLPSARGNLKWERIQSASAAALWIAIHYQRDSVKQLFVLIGEGLARRMVAHPVPGLVTQVIQTDQTGSVEQVGSWPLRPRCTRGKAVPRTFILLHL